MLRNEIQMKTALTRKAIEYYEDKGLLKPIKSENGYRDYSEKDLDILMKVSILRKLGVSVSDIEKYLSSADNSLASVLRKKQHQLENDEKRKELLELIIRGEGQEYVKEKIALMEAEESIYEKLERAFPGFFGHLFFAAYKPFFDEPLSEDGEGAFKKYVSYLDNLAPFELSEEEQKFVDEASSPFDMYALEKISKDKVKLIGNVEEWMKENETFIMQYETYKHSEQYQNSIWGHIQEKLQKYMQDNNYYEIAIPLIRKFSKSYDEYYEKLLEANEQFLKYKEITN